MMNIDKLPVEYRPIKPIAYLGYTLLFILPVIGWIFAIVYSFSNANINRRNYARFFLYVYGVSLIIITIFGLSGGFAVISELIGGLK